MSQVGSRTKW